MILHQLIVDQSGKNVSRARFISYDPDLYINEKRSSLRSIRKRKAQKVIRVVFVLPDFDAMIKQMYDRWR